MSTARQIEANRRNAQKSTGPRTESGRRASSLNAYKHGLTGQLFIMSAEDAEAHERFTASLLQDLKPVGAMEETLARSIADSHWRLNRAAIIENNIFASEVFREELGAERDAARLGVECRFNDVSRARAAVTAFVSDPQRFQLLTVYEARLHRRAQADLKQLRELQAERRTAPEKPEQQTQPTVPAKPVATATQTPESADLSSPNGFVCSPAPTSAQEIEKYLMVDPRQYAPQPAAPPNRAASLR